MAHSNSPPSENDLTSAQFFELLRRLDTDRNRAGEKYEEVHWKLVKFFQWNSCVLAEDLADQTLNRVAEKLAAGKERIEDVVGYAWGVAKKLRQEALRRDLKTVGLDDCANQGDFAADNEVSGYAHREIAQSQGPLKCLRKCIQRLNEPDRRLLLTYHAPKGRRIESRQRLAREFGLTMLALRVRVNRLKYKLESCIKDCLASMAE